MNGLSDKSIPTLRFLGVLNNPFLDENVVLHYVQQLTPAYKRTLPQLLHRHKLLLNLRASYFQYSAMQPVLPALRIYQKQRALRQLQLKGHWLYIHKLLQEAETEFTWIKGFVVQGLFYTAQSQRFFTDLDVLVAPRHIPKALEVLTQNGYKLISRVNLNHLSKSKNSIALVSTDGNKVLLELHHTLLSMFYGQFVFDAVKTHFKLKTLPDIGQISVFNNKFYLHYLILHGTVHRWFRLSWLKDMLFVWEAMDEQSITQTYNEMKAAGKHRAMLVCCSLLRIVFMYDVKINLPVSRLDKAMVKVLTRLCFNAMKTEDITKPSLRVQKILYYWFIFPGWQNRMTYIKQTIQRFIY